MYFIRSGLQRDFIYRYPDNSDIQSINPAYLRDLLQTNIGSIAVAIPGDAQGREISSGQTAIPRYNAENSVVRFFPGNSSSANTKTLHIRYELPANKAQRALADSLLNFIAAIFIPLLGLLLMTPGDIKKHGSRRFFIMICGVLQLGILCWLGFTVWRAFDSLDILFFIQMAIVIVGGILSGAVLWVKNRLA